MAHADYDCCAVCDCKLRYVGLKSTTKETICSTCLKVLRSVGLSILDVEELLAWINEQPVEIVRQTLQSIGFRFCCYPNSVDFAVEEKDIQEADKTCQVAWSFYKGRT